MNPGSGTDVAQTIRIGDSDEGAQFNLQWDDPYDVDGATYGNPLFTANGDLTTATSSKTYTYNATSAQVGKQLEFRTDGVPSGTTDLMLEVTDPDGNSTRRDRHRHLAGVLRGDRAQGRRLQDHRHRVRRRHRPVHGHRPAGAVAVEGHAPTSTCCCSTPTATTSAPRPTTTRSAGVPTRSPASAVPGDIQMVISRSGTGPVGATMLRNIWQGDAYQVEYNDPLSAAFYGHVLAKGATAVAAYDPFKPYLPEPYTSPGGKLPIYFDSAGNRYCEAADPHGAAGGQHRPCELDVLRLQRGPARPGQLPQLRRHQRRGTARSGDRRTGAAEGRWPEVADARPRCGRGSRPRRSTTTSTR